MSVQQSVNYFNQFIIYKTMIKSSHIILLTFIQLTVLLFVLKFYLTSKILPSHCVTSKVSSGKLENVTVIDCIACNQQQNQFFGEHEYNSISIFIPLSSKHKRNLNLNESFQFLPYKQKNSLKEEQFVFTGLAYLRQECQQFQCSALYRPNNFSLNLTAQSSKNLEQIKVDSLNFKESSIPLSQLINSDFTNQKYKMLSGSLYNKPKQTSLALRFRYNAVSDIDAEYQPIFLLHSNQNSIFIRLLLLAPLLLTLNKILGSIFSQNQWAKYLLYACFFSGIVSHNFLIGTAILAIYLTIGELIGKRYLGFLLSLLYFIVAILYNYHVISIVILCFATLFVIYLMFGLEEKNRDNYQNISAVSVVSFNILISLTIGWSTLTVVSICQFLACFTPYIEQKIEKSSYRRVHIQELEEEQDMVVRIERQLGQN